MPRYRVVGGSQVGGVDPGGTVDLNPAAVNISALIRGGHVAPLPEPGGVRRGKGAKARLAQGEHVITASAVEQDETPEESDAEGGED
ncbi:hypothetical protein [Nocardiopsis synnemataformans]|uniref:hypothetical protein n=1 Tax=Nocardiopsis synnemataformans TaxID=61305 RepID=UPI003EBF500F